MKRKMKTSVKISCLILGLILIQQASYAQAQVKAIIAGAYFDQDNAVFGEYTNLDVYSKFISAETGADTTVFGNVFFRYQTNWMSLYNPDWTIVEDNNPAWENVPLGLNLYPLQIFCDSNPNVFRTGPVNVIIIWPAFIGTTPLVDSADFHLFNQDVEFQGTGIIEESPQKFGSTVFPNPAAGTQIVFINSKYTEQIIKVSIMNGLGQIISSKEFIDGENSNGYVLPTDELRSGIYHIQIFYKDKKTEVVKFIKN